MEKIESKLKGTIKKNQWFRKEIDLIFEHSLDSIVLLDKDYNFLRVSKAYANACNRDTEEFNGHNHFEFYPSDLKEEFDEAKKNKRIFQRQARPFVFPEDKERNITYWDLSLVPILDNEEEIELFLYTLKDVTAVVTAEREIKKKYEELKSSKQKAEESDHLKTEFINNLSHEIRTPMNGILGFSQLLNNANLSDEKRRTFVNIIRSSGSQLLRIIDDILEISKLETKQVDVHDKKICLNDLLFEMFSVFDIQAKEMKLPLYLKKGISDRESTIFTDETKLNKILSNLIENALKFTKDGFVEFGNKLIVTEQGKYMQIFVRDTGIGIDSEQHQVIFDRFSQVEKGLARNFGGLGLGLSIAKENTELLGGEITLDSKKENLTTGEIGGTSFNVTIPYQPAFTVPDEIPRDLSIETQAEYTILIVEDEEVNYLYVEILLQDELEINCNVLHAKNGLEAVEICKTTPEIDIVLMDLKMPVMNGFEATKLLKEFRPDLPIIAQTAYTTREDIDKAAKAGCNDFITKPINEEDFREIMKKYLTAG